ncbi:MAG: hypothetical protein KBD16_04250 [Candidatus Pacebacteria bacterium]|nr:hypothetical protein [Candidatus Paceibacterota bacterium]
MRILAALLALSLAASQQAAAKTVQVQEVFLEPSGVSEDGTLFAELVLLVNNGTMWVEAKALPEVSNVVVESQRVIPGETRPWQKLLTLKLACSTLPEKVVPWSLPLTDPYCDYSLRRIQQIKKAGSYNLKLSFTYQGKPFFLLLPNVLVSPQGAS